MCVCVSKNDKTDSFIFENRFAAMVQKMFEDFHHLAHRRQMIFIIHRIHNLEPGLLKSYK